MRFSPFFYSAWHRVAVCSLDCGTNGICESGKCRCNPGYVGALCDQLPCDARCAEHGQCKNGTCVCSQGWNGRHCTLRKYHIIHQYVKSGVFTRRSQLLEITLMDLIEWNRIQRVAPIEHHSSSMISDCPIVV